MIYSDISVHPHLVRIYNEFEKACEVYPSDIWPWKSFNFIEQVSVMMEEAGEAVREANLMREKSTCNARPLYKELTQTAAMCLRCMVQIQEFEDQINEAK